MARRPLPMPLFDPVTRTVDGEDMIGEECLALWLVVEGGKDVGERY